MIGCKNGIDDDCDDVVKSGDHDFSNGIDYVSNYGDDLSNVKNCGDPLPTLSDDQAENIDLNGQYTYVKYGLYIEFKLSFPSFVEFHNSWNNRIILSFIKTKHEW